MRLTLSSFKKIIKILINQNIFTSLFLEMEIKQITELKLKDKLRLISKKDDNYVRNDNGGEKREQNYAESRSMV